ncbi:MAG: aspartyl/asparaginyl beta-hydroxylase domain-containing protein [Elusimicrobia bacterium]|nr:aspartyl/asparaginyl beta-hydroxylase domain-containing protein [Elusimicrobiota bacterium]
MDAEQVASTFRNAHRKFIYGGFKHVTRDEASKAISKDCVLLSDGAGLIYEKIGSAREYRTFDGREILMSPGDVFVRHFFCANPEGGGRTLESLISVHSAAPGLIRRRNRVWIEIYEEDLTSKSVVTEMDFQYRGTKIAGSSEIKGLYCLPRVGADYELPVEQEATVSKIRENFLTAAAVEAVLEELRGCDSYYEQIGSNYNRRKSWSAFQLRGYLPDPKFHERPGTPQWRDADKSNLVLQDTDIAHLFPVTWKFVNSIPGDKERVRFMRLRSDNGELGRHTDLYYKNIGIADGKIARFHVPIVTDADQVVFSGWDARGRKIDRTFDVGTLFYLDFRKPHSVVNRSSVDRIHLVVDCFSSATTRQMIADGVSAYENSQWH